MIFDMDDRLGLESGKRAPPSATDNRQSIHTHADDHLWSRTIHLPKILDRQAFIKAINSLPSWIFRVKGLVEFSGPRQTMLFQYVASHWEITPILAPQVDNRFLTFIGKSKDPHPFEAVEALIRETAISSPGTQYRAHAVVGR